jgi:hypothetical protein
MNNTPWMPLMLWVMLSPTQTMVAFNVIRWCRGRDDASYTLQEATTVEIEIIDKRNNQVVCRGEGANLLQQIMTDGMVDIPNCDFSMIPNDDLIARVVNQNGQTLSDGTDNGDEDNAYDHDRISTDDGRKLGQATALHLLFEKDVEPKQSIGPL